MSAATSPKMATTLATALAASLLLAGCASPTAGPRAADPALLQQAGVPAQLPAQLPAAAGAAAETPAADWRQLVQSPRLAQWVSLALANNRDLQVALLNVQRAQAQLGLADANRGPAIGAGLNASRAPNTRGEQANSLSAGLQLSAWEIDLFGRLANLSEAARAQLLSTEAGRRAAELSLVASVLQAGLALQADEELLALARQALASREQTLQLTQLRESVGAASLLELQAQQTLAAQARASIAQLTRQQAQDSNALALLLGQPVPADAPGASQAASQAATSAMSTSPRLADEAWLAEVPAGLSSKVLLARPDVVAAEQSLRAAQANIAAARVAWWPTLTLTAQAGQASPQLAGLFAGGNFAYTVAAGLAATVFDGGRRQAGVDVAMANQQIARAQYERSLQAAFRETADALAGLATWRAQLAAQTAQRDATRDTARLTELKASQGAASALERLDAQRALWAAEQALVQVRLGELVNRVALFKALGR